MMTLYIKEFLKGRGYKSCNATLRQIGFQNMTAYQLTNNKVKSIKLKHLESLCRAFDCTPNDLLDFQPDVKDQLDPAHSLNKIKKNPSGASPLDLMKYLRPDEVDEARNFLEEMIKKRGRTE